MKAADAAICPTIQAAPVVDQPPKFEKLPNTSLAVAFGARIQRGITMAKNPKMKKERIRPSNSGSLFAPKALKETANTPTAMVISVPCLAAESHQYLEHFELRGPCLPDSWRVAGVLHRSQDQYCHRTLVRGRRNESLPAQCS